MKTSSKIITTAHEPLSVARVNLSALRHNCLALQQIAQNQMVAGPHGRLELIYVIKADAYGHGMLQVAGELDSCGAKFFGVSNVEEGVSLREAGFKQEILLFESTLPELADSIVDYALTPTVCTIELARELHRYARLNNKKIDIHVKVDTGMGRLGVALKNAVEIFKQLRKFEALNIKGICTHFPSADVNEELTIQQISIFMDVIKTLQSDGLSIPLVHASNSMGMIGYKNVFFNLARPGLMLYGLYPAPNVCDKIILEPVLSVTTRIIFLKNISQGQGVSYGHAFVAPRDMTLAVLPIGYNDGFCRALSNRASVLIDGQYCPVVGRVTMDQTIVDVSHIVSPRLGMPVVILGEQKDQTISADHLAAWADTISYEILCNLGSRLPRVYDHRP